MLALRVFLQSNSRQKRYPGATTVIVPAMLLSQRSTFKMMSMTPMMVSRVLKIGTKTSNHDLRLGRARIRFESCYFGLRSLSMKDNQEMTTEVCSIVLFL
mmetsp:Transcript_108550/g.169693  ORF Transcript_108550/g.169693 Transcript_108550/m.169693 type:complete len:100 (-) Transcript_108550:52-351(-)